jgi:ABC-type antimicrobial peptide transport system permease subunit
MKANRTPTPPRWATKLLQWYCAPRLIEEVEGDLHEEFEFQVKQVGVRRAKFDYVRNVIGFIKPFAIRRKSNSPINNSAMIRSYFKIGWRNILRTKGYSLINIGGLAIGMTVAILNGLWIWDEFSHDKYFTNYDRIAQVAETGINPQDGVKYVGTTMTYPLSSELIDHYPQHFERIARVSWNIDCILSSGSDNKSSKGLYVSEAFPEMMTFNMVQGTRAGLASMNSILVSESLAKSFFGTTDILNRTLRINNNVDVTITGVYEDFPLNTEFAGKQFFAPWSLFLSQNKWIEQSALTDWRNHFIKIYVQIHPNTTFESVNLSVKKALQFDPADLKEAIEIKKEIYLYPMSRWHLYPPSYRRSQYNPITMIILVGVIGGFVLLLACINFMNLSTARSEKRAKEVGIRKTVGSVRSQLINQFFTESFLIVTVAFFLALVLTGLFLPAFNTIANKQIVLPWANFWFWSASLCFVVITSALAGSYPALYLSSFNPIKALKGTFRLGRMASIPRQVLVVFQFSISVILIVGTIIVYQQIQFAKSRPVGYDREGLIMIEKKSSDFNGKYNVLRNELKNTGAVVEVSESMGPVTEVYSGNGGWDWKGRNQNVDLNFATLAVSHTHGKTAGWQFVEGRDFDLENVSDSSGLIINESAAKVMGLRNPIGEPVRWTWWMDNRVLDYKILGVIKDMVMASPYEPVEPTMFYLKGFNGTPGWINIKINPQISASDALPKIEAVFKKIIPTAPFEFKFVDEEYAAKFAKEERIGNLASVFAVLAIFISCLGLFGLASFVAEQRTKEIGIRKVLGASVTNLWKMLSKDFIVLVIISCLIAIPISYHFYSDWLKSFQYRTPISWWIFAASGLGAVFITVVTVSFQAIKAALANPVNSLKSE